MNILNLLFFIFITYGISNIVVYSHLFDTPRNFFYKKAQGNSLFWKKTYELITCMMCFSTWVGFIVSTIDLLIGNTLNFTPSNIIFSGVGLWAIPIIVFFDGVFASGTTWVIHTLQEYMEKGGNSSVDYIKQLQNEINERDKELKHLSKDFDRFQNENMDANNLLNKLNIKYLNENGNNNIFPRFLTLKERIEILIEKPKKK